ncbi:MAG: hypothetical protein HQM12_21150 [SAR324 cluster bacterium]|nr:hypothetical protein [SAR324 cluster bacterium]
MRNNRHIINTFGQKQSTEEIEQLNSFSFFAIRDELHHITEECESLLSRGKGQSESIPQQEQTMKILMTQLQELRKYSEQIEIALKEFEDRLIEMEESLAARSLCN